MKRSLIGGFAAILAVGGLAAGCASGNGASGKSAVRVVTNAQDVTGCEKLTLVQLSGTWTKNAGNRELEDLVRAKGGNVLLLPDGDGAKGGVAYKCSGGGASGAP